MKNMMPSRKEIVVCAIIVSVLGWGVISCLILLLTWLYKHVLINFI